MANPLLVWMDTCQGISPAVAEEPPTMRSPALKSLEPCSWEVPAANQKKTFKKVFVGRYLRYIPRANVAQAKTRTILDIMISSGELWLKVKFNRQSHPFIAAKNANFFITTWTSRVKRFLSADFITKILWILACKNYANSE